MAVAKLLGEWTPWVVTAILIFRELAQRGVFKWLGDRVNRKEIRVDKHTDAQIQAGQATLTHELKQKDSIIDSTLAENSKNSEWFRNQAGGDIKKMAELVPKIERTGADTYAQIDIVFRQLQQMDKGDTERIHRLETTVIELKRVIPFEIEDKLNAFQNYLRERDQKNAELINLQLEALIEKMATLDAWVTQQVETQPKRSLRRGRRTSPVKEGADHADT